MGSGVAEAAASNDEWLSAQLGRAVWKLTRDCDPGPALAAADPGPAMFFTRIPADDIAAVHRFEDSGFHLVDTTITLEIDSDRLKPVGAGARFARPEDRHSVGQIAAESFEWSRLHLDPEVPRDIADTSRRSWAVNFFDGARGDQMIVADANGRPSAFLLALGPTGGTATIDLIAVDKSARRRGLGAACICFLAGLPAVKRLRVGTQAANLGSLRFYETLGFRTVAAHYVLHLHRG